MKPQMRVIFWKYLKRCEFRFMVSAQASDNERPSPDRLGCRRKYHFDYWISVSFFFELS